jgi:hypothetical protein
LLPRCAFLSKNPVRITSALLARWAILNNNSAAGA